MWSTMSALLVKGIAITIFFLITIIVGGATIPLFTSKAVEKHAKNIIPIFKCLTGGLFLGIVLLDLIPESAELVTEALGEDFPFPISGAIIGGAIFFVVSLEIIADSINNARKKSKSSDYKKSTSKDDNGKVLIVNADQPPPHVVDDRCDEATLKFEIHESSCDVNNPKSNHIAISGGGDEDTCPCKEMGCQTTPILSRKTDSEDQDSDAKNDEPAILNRIIITIVLCFHTLMEGLGLGLQRSNESVWNLLIPLSLHQSLLSFIFSINLLRCHFSKKVVFLLIVILGVSAVVGAALGAYFAEQDDNTTMTLVNGVLLNVATGTFLFITFFEMLKFEGEGPSPLLRLFAALLGFGLIMLLDYFKIQSKLKAQEAAGGGATNSTKT